MSALLQFGTELRFRDPWLLLLALVLPLGIWIRHRRGVPTIVFAPSLFLERLPHSLRRRLSSLPRVFQSLGLLFVVLALARPIQRVRLPLESEGIDILLCLDVSSSMAARDLDPAHTRLDLAKKAAAEFVGGRTSDRFGLIRFARYPDLLSPLTLDHRALTEFLEALQQVQADGLEDLTGIGSAVARAAEILRTSPAKSKVVILLTDGEENVATAETPHEIGPLRAARMCQELGVRVYTIAAGIGRRGRGGEWVDLDTTQVRELAERTGGAFFEARDAGAIAGVYGTIDRLEKVQFEKPRYELRERFLPFLLTALSLLLAGRTLRASSLEVLP